MSTRLAALLALSGLTLAACSSNVESAGPGPSSDDDGGAGADVVGTTADDGSVATTQMVGAGGGTVTSRGVALDIPAGALAGDTMITVTNGGAIPTGYVGLSALFQFGPDGTVFQQPVKVSFTISGGTDPAVFWSNAQGGYDELPTTVSGTTASASVTHFSRGFTGESHRHQAMDATATTTSDGSADDAGGSSSGNASSSGSSSGGSSSGGSSGSASSGSSGGSSSGSSSGTSDASTGSSSGSSGASSSGSSSGGSDASASGSSSGGSSGSSSGGSSGQGADSGAPDDSGAADAGSTADSGSPADASGPPPGITVTIDGTPTFFGYSVTASPLQAWVVVSANDTATVNGGYWNMKITAPAGPQALQCQGSGSYPSITYTHYPALNSPPDQTFKSVQCVIMESTSAMTSGSTAAGTFSGSVMLQTDSGNAPSHTLSAGSYDAVLP
jgi:hypothetical protein